MNTVFLFYLRHLAKMLKYQTFSPVATILPLCTKYLINVVHIKIQYALHIYSTMCKTYGIQTYGIDFRGANSKYKGIMVSYKRQYIN